MKNVTGNGTTVKAAEDSTTRRDCMDSNMQDSFGNGVGVEFEIKAIEV